MSRTSRRVSRPLIAGLAVVIVLGVVFTVHKLHKARAADSDRNAVALHLTEPAPTPSAPPDKPKVQVIAPTPSPVPAAAPEHPKPAPEPAADSGALVTQTPTEKVSATPTSDFEAQPRPTPAPLSTPAANAVTDSAPATDSPSDPNETASLQEWAKGNKPAAKDLTATPKSDPTPAPAASPAQEAPAAVPTIVSAQPMEDAKAKQAGGDLIAARQILNDALIANHGDTDALKKQIEQINESLVFSARKFPEDPWGGNYQVAGGERLGSIANRGSVTWELLSRINGVTPKRLRSGQIIKLVKGPFHAIVCKHLFKMELYLGAPGGPGSMYIRSFPVGLGKDNSTPTGLWMCKAGDKIRNPRYYPPRGGDIIAPDDPKNPLGGYWIALEGLDGQALGKESYGIHGTIDPDSIGKMASMGCIRMKADDISWVFDLLVDGKSKIVVKD